MKADDLDDLKQLIVSTANNTEINLRKDMVDIVTQHTANLATKNDLRRMGRKLGGKIDDLDLKMDTISVALHVRLKITRHVLQSLSKQLSH